MSEKHQNVSNQRSKNSNQDNNQSSNSKNLIQPKLLQRPSQGKEKPIQNVSESIKVILFVLS